MTFVLTNIFDRIRFNLFDLTKFNNLGRKISLKGLINILIGKNIFLILS